MLISPSVVSKFGFEFMRKVGSLGPFLYIGQLLSAPVLGKKQKCKKQIILLRAKKAKQQNYVAKTKKSSLSVQA